MRALLLVIILVMILASAVSYASNSTKTNVSDSVSADKLFQEKKYDEALKGYNKAIELDSNNGALHVKKAKTLAKVKRYIESIDEYTKAIRLGGNLTEIYYNRGLSNLKIKSYSEALNDFLSAKSLTPTNPKLLLDIGRVYLEKGDYGLAQVNIENALQYNPNLNKAKLYLARAYAGVGNLFRTVELMNSSRGFRNQPEEFYEDISKKLINRGINKSSIESYITPLSNDTPLKILLKTMSKIARGEEISNNTGIGHGGTVEQNVTNLVKNQQNAINAKIAFAKGDYYQVASLLSAKIDSGFGEKNDYLLRAQSYIYLKQKDLACRDVKKLCSIGNCSARKYLKKIRYCN